ncbi:MAG: hypothetical protein AAGB18_04230 [Pseudomonadota bacterium]
MRPLISSLFVFSVFGLFAGHVANNVLNPYLVEAAPQILAMINSALDFALIKAFGIETSVYILLVAGAFFALWTYLAETSAQQVRRQERFSTW